MRLHRDAVEGRPQKSVAAIRESVAAAGRDPRSVLIFNLQTVIVDETDAKAKAKYEDYKQYINLDGALALGSGWMGIDFGRYAPDEPLRHIETNAVQSSVEAFLQRRPEQGMDGARAWRNGSASAAWGLCLSAVLRPSRICSKNGSRRPTSTASISPTPSRTRPSATSSTHLVPELQKRGVYKRDYAPGTLREKLFGGGPRLPQNHIGAQHRDLARNGARSTRPSERPDQ